MNWWLAPQIDYLIMLQNFREMTNGIFDNFFMFITAFGEITIPMTVIAGIYWCIDSKKGMLILLNWSIATFICHFLKITFCIYRPWILDGRVTPIASSVKMAGGYSFPSGHTAIAASVWGCIAYLYRHKKLFCASLIILVFLIAFSRNYIGVHTPQDVIASLIIGIILIPCVENLIKWLEAGEKRDIYFLIFSLILCFILILYGYFKTYPVDYSVSGEILVSPEKMRIYALPTIGLFYSSVCGWFLNKRFLKFDGSKGTCFEKIIRFLVGAAFLSAMNSILSQYLSLYCNKSIKYFIIGAFSILFITYIYPLIIILLKNFKNKIIK